MENLFYNISQILGITIIHSLWQGLIIYMLLRMYVQCFSGASASSKHRLAFAALLAMLGWFGITLYNEVSHYNWHPVAYTPQVPLTLPNALHELTAPDSRYSFAFAGYLPYVTMLYLAGLVFNVLKLLLAWNNIYRIRQNTTAAGFEQLVSALAKKLNLKNNVKVAFSEWIDVPCITGYIKPIILLPLTIGNTLNADEIAAILVHELAHIKRNDYLLNLVQQVVSIVLFFNPFARLTGNIINQERENCCDDVVVQITGSPLIYAQALLKLEENKQAQWYLALAATGNKYHLLNRIERIMKTKKQSLNIRPVLLALLLLTFSLSSIAWFNPKVANGKVSVKAVPNPLAPQVPATDTTIKKKTAKNKPVRLVTRKGHTYTTEIDDPELERLAAEVQKHGENIGKYYDSPEFAKLQEQLKKEGKRVEEAYNSPAMKSLQEQLARKSADMANANNNADMKRMQDQIEAYGTSVGKYYSSPEYLKLQKELQKEAIKLGDYKSNSADYKKQQKRLAELTQKITAYSTSPEIAVKQAELAKLSTQYSAYYTSDDYKKQIAAVQSLADSISNNVKLQTQQSSVAKMSKAMQDYQKRPEIAREMEAMKAAQRKMTNYMQSPAYKARLKEAMKVDSDVQEAVRKEEAAARAESEKAAKQAAENQKEQKPVEPVEPAVPMQ